MATSLVSPLSSEALAGEEAKRERGFAALLTIALAPLALAVHGYHPYAEDGGLYLPEIKRLLHPEMYPRGSEFVVGHLRFSIFAPFMAALTRSSHLTVESVFLLVHLVTLWATLFAAWLLAARCWGSREARSGAVILLATWITLPIAGTSLMLMDPYVTARSFSTPCALLALAGALKFLLPQERTAAATKRGLLLCCSALGVAVMMHPLMGAYACGCVLLLGCILSRDQRVRVWGTIALCLTAIAVAGALQLSSAPETAAYHQVALTRYYWFLSEWHWYELVGLVAPLLILSAVAFGRPGWTLQDEGYHKARIALARMAVAAGIAAMAVAAFFARIRLVTHEVARLQPLRIFQLVYIVMILMVGAVLAENVLRRSMVRWLTVFSLLAGVMVIVERQTYPDSAHVELQGFRTGSEPRNPWEQAFLWISRNTPNDAMFALDAHYITSGGEDTQGFRAIAERSVLPDYSKDGGVVANNSALTTEWMTGEAAQTELNRETDARRLATLKPLGVSWAVLDRSAVTGFPCEYANRMVKVCRLP